MDFNDLPGKFYIKSAQASSEYTEIPKSQVWQESELFYRGAEKLLFVRGDNDDSLEALSEIDNLVGIDFAEVGNISPEGLKHLKRAKNLRSLNISGIFCEIPTIQSLAEIPGLEELVISGTMTDFEIIRELTTIRNLRHLGIIYLSDKEEDWKAFSHLDTLQSLSIDTIGNSGNVLPFLSQMKNLRKLHIKYSDIKDYQSITQFPALQELHLESCKISYQDLAFLRQVSSLQKVSFKFCDNITSHNITELKDIQAEIVDYSGSNSTNFAIFPGKVSDSRVRLAIIRGLFFSIAAFLFGLLMWFLNYVHITFAIFAIFAWIENITMVCYFAAFIGTLGAMSGIIQNSWLNALASVALTYGALYMSMGEDLSDVDELIVIGVMVVTGVFSGGFGYWLCSED